VPPPLRRVGDDPPPVPPGSGVSGAAEARAVRARAFVLAALGPCRGLPAAATDRRRARLGFRRPCLFFFFNKHVISYSNRMKLWVLGNGGSELTF